jgi:hypothetical protein
MKTVSSVASGAYDALRHKQPSLGTVLLESKNLQVPADASAGLMPAPDFAACLQGCLQG